MFSYLYSQILKISDYENIDEGKYILKEDLIKPNDDFFNCNFFSVMYEKAYKLIKD